MDILERCLLFPDLLSTQLDRDVVCHRPELHLAFPAVAGAGSGTKVQLDWNEPDAPWNRAASYLIAYGTNAQYLDATFAVGSSTTHVVTPDLDPGLHYFFSVQAENAAGASDPSAIASVRTYPPLPTVNTGSVTAGLRWLTLQCGAFKGDITL